MARKLGELFYEVRGRTEGLQKDLADSERQFGKLSAFVIANPVVAIGAVATAIGGIAAAATRMASQVEQSMRRVANVTRGSAADLGALRDEIARLSRESGRSQGDLAVAAEAAARNSESIVATGQRLRAGLQLAQVTGEDLTATLDGLDGVLDLFGLSSAEAGEAVAELFTAARGTAPVSELFALLQAGAPAIKQLGLDLPTAARAVLALSESGLSGKKAASELAAIASAGAAGRAEIERLAASIPRSVDPMKELAGAYADVNSTAEVAANKIRQEFSGALIALGTRILPPVTAAMNALVAVIDRLKGRASGEVIGRALAEIEEFGVAAAQTVNRASPTAPALDKIVTAVARLGEASRNGALDLQSLTENQIAELRAQLEGLAKTPALDNRALGLGATKQQIQALLALLAKVPAARSAAEAPPGTGRAEGRFSDGLEAAKAAAKVAEEAARQAKTLREVSEGFDTLIGKARQGNISLSDFARTLRELGEQFADGIEKPTKAQAAAFDALRSRALAAFASLQQLTRTRLADDFRRQLAALTPTVVDDLRLAFEALKKELGAKIVFGAVTGDQAQQVLELRRALDDAAIAAEGYADWLAEVEASSISAMDAQLQLVGELQRSEAQLQQLQALQLEGGAQTGDDVRIVALQKRIAQLKADIERLGGTVSTTFGDQPRQFSDALTAALQTAYGLSTALGGVNDGITRAIGGALQLAQSFSQIADLAAKAGGIGQVSLGSLIPGIGGIVGGIGSIIGGLTASRPEDPVQRQLVENLKLNAQRLEDLRAGIEELTVSLSGRELSAIRDVDLVTTRRINIGGGIGTAEDPRNIKDILADLREAGVSLNELRKAASDLGVTLSETPTIDELRQLQDAIRSFSLARLTQTISGAMRQLDTLAQLDPARFGGLAGTLKQIELLTGPKGVPAIGQALAGLDLSTAEGRAEAIQRLIGLVENIGDISLDDLGSLDPDAFIAAIVKLITGLENAQPPVKTAAEQFETAFEALAAAFEAGVFDSQAYFAKLQELVAEQFPELFANLDFSSFEAFKGSVAAIVAGFAADGELSDAEREQIAILQKLTDGYAATTDAMLDQLDVLDRRFALGDESAVDRFQQTFTALVAQFPELATLLDGIDLNTAEGRDLLKQRIRDAFEAAAVDGISESERPFVDALARLFGLVGDVSAEALASISERARAILALADREIDVNGITDPIEIVRIRVRSLSEAFPELAETLAQFNLSTVEGREALNAFVDALLLDPERLAAMAATLGISVDDLIAMFLRLNGAVDSALPKIETLADQIAAAFDAVDFDIALNGITDPLQRLTLRAQAAAKAIPEVSKALAGLDLSTVEGRNAAISQLVALGGTTTNEAIKQAVLQLLGDLRGIAAPADATDAGAPPSSASTIERSGIQQITERTGLSMVELLRQNNRQNDELLQRLGDGGEAGLGGAIGAAIASARQALDALVTRLPTLSPASLFARLAPADLLRPPAAPTVAEGGVLVQIRAPITVNVYGPMSAAEAQATGQTVGGAIREYVEKTLGTSLIDIRNFRAGYPS